MRITPELSEFVGAFIGDGYLKPHRRQAYLAFAGHAELDLEYYEQTIVPRVLFVAPEMKPHIYFINNTHALKVLFTGLGLTQLMRELGFRVGVKTYTVTIPQQIWEAGEACMNAVVRGIFDTDGCVYIDKRPAYKTPYPRIVLQTASKPLFQQLVVYLGARFSVHAGHIPSRNIYKLEIYGHAQVAKWMATIGFSNPRHLRKLQQASVA